MSVWPYSTQRWQRLRLLKLQQNPLCEACLQVGEIEPAVAVDHRNPISERAGKSA
jgi:5-methylcytosine-specific restriction enzyme A